MHAYNRTEADGSDSIAVCATKDEWQQVIDDIIKGHPEDAQPATHRLFTVLDQMGLV
jgi:hypothetical protein